MAYLRIVHTLLRAFVIAWACLMTSTPASAATTALHLEGVTPRADAAGHLEWLPDPSGNLTVAQADAATSWSALRGNLNAGFTSDIAWLRLHLWIDALPPEGWVLRLNNALIDDAQVYARQSDGAWQRLGHGGEDVPRMQWPVDYRSPAFQYAPQAPGAQELMIRLQSKNALTTRVEVWQRLAFDNASRREGLFFGLYFGFYLLLICVHGIFWWYARTPISSLFLAYIGICILNEVLTLGLIQQITHLPVWWSDRLLGIGISASAPIAVMVALLQLESSKHYPRLSRWMTWQALIVAFIAIPLVGAGHYAMGVSATHWNALLLIAMLVWLDGALLLRGHPPARFFALAFGVFYASILVGFLRNLGYLPVNAWTEHASALGTMLHMLLLSLYILWYHERERRARERRQADLLMELAVQDNQRLEQQVQSRTAELRDEITRRERLEDELRASLELERRVREEQRDFVAMVSHEFRTPLAIIGTSAQQLERNLSAAPDKNQPRCRNIQDAVRRLLALVDAYLAGDRMSDSPVEPRPQPCDPRALVEDLRREFPPDRIRIAAENAPATLCTDASLLQIALRNLLANADRHAPPDSAVQVALSQICDQVCIDIHNAGERITDADQARLFQKYYRGSNAQQRPGVGLGLYLVRAIAEKLGGSAELISAGGHEPIRFRLCLPLQPAAPASEQGASD